MSKVIMDYPVCFNCKHRLGVRQCEAFLDMIPDVIWVEGDKHIKPLLNQENSIVFEKINTAKK